MCGNLIYTKVAFQCNGIWMIPLRSSIGTGDYPSGVKIKVDPLSYYMRCVCVYVCVCVCVYKIEN